MAVDPHSHNQIVMGEIHAMIHAGKFFTVCHYDAAVVDDGDIEVIISAGAKSVHCRHTFAAGGDAVCALFEQTVTSADGTALTPHNRKRIDPASPVASFFHTPTITGDGVQLGQNFMPGGTGGNFSAGGQAAGFEEWILAPNTKYLYRLTNVAGTTQPLGMILDFYEASPG